MTMEEILANSSHYAYMFRIRLYEVQPKIDCEHPLSLSKCRIEEKYNPLRQLHPILDNGRIIMCQCLETTITEQDLFTLSKFYSWSKEEIFDVWEYEKQYLPTNFVVAILKLYKDKTELKDVEGREVDYQVAKGMLNSAYGMTVTDIVREALYYDDKHNDNKGKHQPFFSNYDLMKEHANGNKDVYEEMYNVFLKEQINRYNTNPYRFLFYAWGVWVTAYARRNLFTGIEECNQDYVYSDTDSIKLLNLNSHQEYFDSYNEEISMKLRKACEYHQIDFELTRPKNKKGVEKPLGIWEYEGTYDEFKTLGAKRYLWRENNKWNLTCAGVNKKSGMDYLHALAQYWNCTPSKPVNKYYTPFDFFTLNPTPLVVPAEWSGRNVLTYIDEERSGEVTDYLGETISFTELSGIHMESTEYSLDPMKAFLNYLFQIKEDSW